MDPLRRLLEQVDTNDFSGVVRVELAGRPPFELATGSADRRHGIANRPGTRFAIASGAKGFTALVVMSLVDDGTLRLDTRARGLLGPDLPLVDDLVTVEHLLTHTSGIGDYLDESLIASVDDYVLDVPVHRLADTEDFLAVLEGHPQVSAPGERFAYNNGGYVVLALLAERATGSPFDELVTERICRPAGLDHTSFLRSDELPADAAIGYLDDGLRTNVFHLPVRGNGDGGIFTTAADVHRLWRALDDGLVVRPETFASMTTPRHDVPEDDLRYGMGFWLHRTGPAVLLEGHDAGVSFRTRHDRAAAATYTVISNTSDGAWPVVRAIDEVFDAQTR